MTSLPLTQPALWAKARPWLIASVTFAILCLVAYWGGAAKIDARFWTGVVILSALILAFGAVTWWLFLSPVPAGKKVRLPSLSLAVRQAVAFLATISNLMLVAGGTWDEAWHRRFGVGAAINDFFWQPHLMIYGSMALTSLFAMGGLLLLLRGRGDVRLRFRAEPMIGLLALTSAFAAFSAPSDAVWHQVYGLDITAWSLPHVMLSTSIALVMLTTAAMHLSQRPAAAWRGLGALSLPEALAALMLGASVVLFTLIAATEWESITAIGAGLPAAFWTRPEWLYPVVVLSIASLYGHVALYAARRVGFATLVMLVALGLRWGLMSLGGLTVGQRDVPVTAHLLLLLPALALDGWYWLRRRDPESNTTLMGGALVSNTFGLLTILPLIATTMVFPRVNASTVPAMILWGLLMGLWFAWTGSGVGRWLSRLGAGQERVAALSPRAVWVGASALVLLALFTVVYMLTAIPPTA
ncbi:MAG: hypothetical protein KIT87_16290 [Anaerolineae bacterium]|nr:hypothetical protein [Anaerolineae bacterium]